MDSAAVDQSGAMSRDAEDLVRDVQPVDSCEATLDLRAPPW